MDVVEALMLRKTVKRFEKEGLILTREKIEEMLALAMLTPTEFGLRPWRFVVVRDSARKEALYECCYRLDLVREASAVVVVCGDTLAYQDTLFERRGTGDQGTGTHEGGYDRVQALKEYYASDDYRRFLLAVRSSSACAMALMLVATERGIGSCPIFLYDEARLREEFGIPDHWVVVLLCAFGMPAAGAEAFEKPEKQDAKAVIWHEGVEVMRF